MNLRLWLGVEQNVWKHPYANLLWCHPYDVTVNHIVDDVEDYELMNNIGIVDDYKFMNNRGNSNNIG